MPHRLIMTPPLILQGLSFWRQHKYFEAHEAWETHWHAIRKDDSRKEEADYVKGMVQLAVALVHHERGNLQWYEKLLSSGPQLLASTEEPYAEISREALLEQARQAPFRP